MHSASEVGVAGIDLSLSESIWPISSSLRMEFVYRKGVRKKNSLLSYAFPFMSAQ